MKHLVDRRDFLRTAGAMGATVTLLSSGSSRLMAAALAKGAPHAEKLGWRLGCQAYTFNRFTFQEAIDKTASVGLRYIEMYPGQSLTKEKPDIQTNESMSMEVRKRLQRRLAEADVKLVCYGVCGLSKDEAGSRRTFEFAKAMGIETIVSEPEFDAFDTVEKLCEEYQVNVALHNHPKPSRYWDPETVLKVCKGRSKRIGACADTGHWMRSGIKPIEALQKLAGRIITFHFKDLNQYGEEAHDVPWGTGQGDVQGMLTEIHRQGFKGVFSIEYEYNWLNSLPEIAQSVEYFDRVAGELAGRT